MARLCSQAIIFSLFAFISAGAGSLAYAATVKAGNVAPDFTLNSMSGKNLRLKDMRGEVVMVNFWATWCGPCRQEMPLLDGLYKRYRKSGFTLLGVNIDNDRANAVRMAKKLKVSFPVLFDTDKQASELYSVSAMPYTVLIDRDGRVRHVHRGFRPGVEKKYDKQVKQLLGI